MKLLNQIALGALLATAALAQACSSDNDNPRPDDGDIPGDDGGGAPGGNTGGSGTGTGGNGDGGAPPATGGSIQPPPDRENCPDEPDGVVASGPNAGTECWDVSKCNGTTEEQFLESCNGTCFEKYDNEENIEGYTGTLPALP